MLHMFLVNFYFANINKLKLISLKDNLLNEILGKRHSNNIISLDLDKNIIEKF